MVVAALAVEAADGAVAVERISPLRLTPQRRALLLRISPLPA
jgi:hypothetical protein